MPNDQLLPHKVRMLIPSEKAFMDIAHLLPASGWEYPIFSCQTKTKQRKAKKKGISVALVYLPKARITEHLHRSLDPDCFDKKSFFIRIKLYNETNGHEGFSPEKAHYIPIRSMAGVFLLYDAIKKDMLFEFYWENWLQDEWLPTASQYAGPEEDDPNREKHRTSFYGGPYASGLFGHNIYLYDKDNCAKGYSSFAITYCPTTKKGEPSLLPWTFTCLEAPRLPVCNSFITTGEQITQVDVRLSQEQLLELIEKIYQTICQLPTEILNKSIDKTNRK